MSAKTDRITVRIPVQLINQMDALVELGDFRNRTDVVFQALKSFVREHGSQAMEAIESEKGLVELQKMAAMMREMKQNFGQE